MKFDNLNDLPEWDDDDLNDFDDEENEGWKPNPTRDACKALYNKWNSIVTMLNGVIDDLPDDEPGQHSASFIKDRQGMILGDAFEVAAKIRSSDVVSMYIAKMENAAIIRKNAQYIKSAMLGLMAEDVLDEEHCTIIRSEIDAFRQLFIQWVNTFKKDEYEDEWGLFV